MIRKDVRTARILACMYLAALATVLLLMALPLSPVIVLWLTTRSGG